jgi:photosystem II stability/assembly factor-like uncharacterized protein
MDAALLQALEWRSIGPYRGGRVVAVAGDPSEPEVFYFGACAGGVWKTADGGQYWQNVSDGFFKTASVGALAVAESDSNIIYAGTGESCIRGNVSHGDGVYKSTDGGRTWKNAGLRDTRHIARIRVHPSNPDLVYVAALGHAFGPSEERGVFRSIDGGETWEKILFRSERAGAIDLSMDPHHPGTLYAAVWQTVRTPWSLESGGPESSLYRSTDGGDSWTELTNNPGLPSGLKGRIGVALAPSRPSRVWAVVEAEDGGLFRSDDAGETWGRVSEDGNLSLRPWYYMHVFADPQDTETVYVLNVQAWKSTDGGRTFTQLTTPHGDNHDLWIDPRNTQRMIQGNDGGACVSSNGGDSWSTIYNQPTAQFYHLVADDQTPYRVYGTQQDNSAVSAPSRSGKGAITWPECYPVGSSESGYIAVRPDNPNIVYSGAIGSAPGGGGVLLRYDHGSGQTKIITVWPETYSGWGARDLRHRFQWTYPIVISPHDPNTLYVTGERVFRSRDEGQSWEAISPDLSRNDVERLGPSGGPITKDTTGAEHYCTIFAFAESPHESGVFWAGSDDGLVHVSRDGGKSWENVTPSDLPAWTTVNMIELSPHDAGTAYVASHRYKLDDYQSFLHKTSDYGKTWQTLEMGALENDFIRCVREDPSRRGLLYAGTETSIYVSIDDGATWQPFRQNLPVVPVYDLAVKGTDLIAATHGRAFWILDDLSPLHQMPEQISEPVHLFKPRPTTRFLSPTVNPRRRQSGKMYQLATGLQTTFYERQKTDGGTERVFLDAGQNPPDGVMITYFLREAPEDELSLTIRDAQGREVRRFSSKASEQSDGDGPLQPRLPARPGTNRFVWDLRYSEARRVPGDVTTEQMIIGPLARPGTYQVELSLGGMTYSETATVLKDPRVQATQQDFDEQFALLIAIRDKLSETHDAINALRSVKQQVDEWERRLALQPEDGSASEPLKEAAGELKRKLTETEGELIQGRAKVSGDRLNLPSRLNVKLAALASVVSSADGAPTRQSRDVFAHVSALIDEQLQRLRQVLDTDVAGFNELVQRSAVPAIVPPALARQPLAAAPTPTQGTSADEESIRA